MDIDVDEEPPAQTFRAGWLLFKFARHQARHGEASVEQVREIVRMAHAQAADDFKYCKTAKDYHRVLAAQQAAEAMLEQAEGREPTGVLAAFDTLAKNHEGEEHEIDLGRKGKPSKLTFKDHWLRAAASVIWEERPNDREQLVRDAKKLGLQLDRKSLAKLVDNMDQGRLKYDEVHKPLVKALYDVGWTSLTDFC